jgi:hypothetical protein
MGVGEPWLRVTRMLHGPRARPTRLVEAAAGCGHGQAMPLDVPTGPSCLTPTDTSLYTRAHPGGTRGRA